MSIKTKLLLAATVTLLIVGLASGFVQYYVNNQKLTEHTKQDIKGTIDYTFQLINFYFGRVETNVNNFANDPLVVEALIAKDPQKLQQVSDKMTTIVEISKIIETMALMEVNGSTCTNVTASKASLSIVGKDFSERDYCKGIIKTKVSYLSSAYIGAVTKHPNLAMVIPVKNDKGEMIGFVSGVIDLSELRGYLWDLQKDSKTDLLDRYGVLFLTTEKKIEKLDTGLGPEEKEVAEIQKRLTDNKTEGYFESEGDFVGYRSNGAITVIFEKSTKTLSALSQYLNLIVFLSWAVALLLAVISIYFFVGTITKKISRISQIVKKIAGGKFDIRLDEKDLKGKDETGVLARSFNEMAIKLADIYKNLETKVKQRTAEVEEKNKKMAVSEAELKKVLELSERANQVMVGRELRMKEMKKRIEELESRITS